MTIGTGQMKKIKRNSSSNRLQLLVLDKVLKEVVPQKEILIRDGKQVDAMVILKAIELMWLMEEPKKKL